MIRRRKKARYVGPPRLPGRPRKDGLPPVQKAKPELNPDLKAIQLARLRHLAGRGLPVSDIATLTGFPLEDLQPGGALAGEIKLGKAQANLQIADALFQKALDGKTIESLFWAKCNLGWSETPQGRAKVAAENEENEITAIKFTITDETAPAQTPILRKVQGHGSST